MDKPIPHYNTAIFPGQGAQKPGMGMDFLSEFPEARAVFHEAGEALKFDVIEVCTQADSKLDLTEFAQPCILTTQIAMFRALRKHFRFSPQYFGGHSLGEYTALVAAGAIPFATAVRLVRLRGALMQKAVPIGEGQMVALVMEGLPLREIRILAEKVGVDIANDNSPSQVVLSGTTAKMQSAVQALKPYEAREMRIIPLNASAPFHSIQMKTIEEEFKLALEKNRDEINADLARNVTSNWSGGFHTGSVDDLIGALVRQISATVRWQENMKTLAQVATSIVEIGPDRPLRGFFKSAGIDVAYVLDVRTARRAFDRQEARHDPV